MDNSYYYPYDVFVQNVSKALQEKYSFELDITKYFSEERYAKFLRRNKRNYHGHEIIDLIYAVDDMIEKDDLLVKIPMDCHQMRDLLCDCIISKKDYKK